MSIVMCLDLNSVCVCKNRKDDFCNFGQMHTYVWTQVDN